jgi:NitT/TauT family transport system permease protein
VRIRPVGGTLLAITILAVAWEWVARTQQRFLPLLWTLLRLDPPAPDWAFLSSPSAIGLDIPAEIAGGALVKAAGTTFWHTVLAASTSFILGVLAAAWLRRSARVGGAVLPLLQGLSGVPPVTLLPVLLVAFGLGHGSVVALAILGASLSATFITLHGLAHVDPELRTMLSKLGYSRLGVWLWSMSSAAPHLSTAARESVRWSLILVVVGEMHGSVAGGLGAYVDSGRLNQQYSLVYIGIVSCGVLAFALSRALEWCGSRVHAALVSSLLNARTRTGPLANAAVSEISTS